MTFLYNFKKRHTQNLFVVCIWCIPILVYLLYYTFSKIWNYSIQSLTRPYRVLSNCTYRRNFYFYKSWKISLLNFFFFFNWRSFDITIIQPSHVSFQKSTFLVSNVIVISINFTYEAFSQLSPIVYHQRQSISSGYNNTRATEKKEKKTVSSTKVISRPENLGPAATSSTAFFGTSIIVCIGAMIRLSRALVEIAVYI